MKIDPNLFKERSFEMVETDEIAKVGKTARVIEEVSLGKEVVEKVQTIKETLRRQDVQGRRGPAARPYKEYDSDFRSFFKNNLTKSGVTLREPRARVPLRLRPGHPRAVPQQSLVGRGGGLATHLGGKEPRNLGAEQGR